MNKLILRSICLCMVLICLGCATTSTVKNAPLSKGVSKTFKADFNQVRLAVNSALVETDLEIISAHRTDQGGLVVLAEMGVSMYSWGEIVRVVLEEKASSVEVRVLTKRKLATNVTAEDDYSDRFFSLVDSKLE